MNVAPMPTQTPLINWFLQGVDHLGDRMGVNVPQLVDLELLQALPLGTFGRAVADFYHEHHLQPFTTGPRRKQLHDCVHVLTGYGTDAIGELEVQAFLLGAKFHLFQLVIGGGLLRVAHRHGVTFPLTRSQVRQRLRAAYRRGQAAHWDVDTWQPETLWHLPLADVQAQFQVSTQSTLKSVDPKLDKV